MGQITRKAACATLAMACLLPGPGFAETSSALQLAQEEVFLKVVPQFQVPDDVQPILGAVNEEFRNCRHLWPREYTGSQARVEARAYRDIYGFVKARNVIIQQDCTCTGKVAAWADVEKIAREIREQTGKAKLSWQETRSIFEASEQLFAVVETLCGGRF